MSGAKISLKNVDSKAIRATVSNGAGFFSMNALQPATYDPNTSKGFDRYKVAGIQIHPGDEVTIETIKMKVGAVEQEITVSATTAGVILTRLRRVRSSPRKTSSGSRP